MIFKISAKKQTRKIKFLPGQKKFSTQNFQCFIPFSTFYHYSVETCSEIGIKSWLFQRSVLYLVFFAFFVKNFVIHFLCRTNDPEQMSGSSQTYLFNSNYNIDPSSSLLGNSKICVSFAIKYMLLGMRGQS